MWKDQEGADAHLQLEVMKLGKFTANLVDRDVGQRVEAADIVGVTKHGPDRSLWRAATRLLDLTACRGVVRVAHQRVLRNLVQRRERIQQLVMAAARLPVCRLRPAHPCV